MEKGDRKEPICDQQLIESCSFAQGHVFDLFAAIGEY
jgi:hypothetical protein